MRIFGPQTASAFGILVCMYFAFAFSFVACVFVLQFFAFAVRFFLCLPPCLRIWRCICFAYCWAEAAGARHKGEKKLRPNPEDDQNEKHKSECGGRPKCKKNASLQTEAGQNATKHAKKCKSLRSLPESLTIWKLAAFSSNCIFLRIFCVVFCIVLHVLFVYFFALFFAFWPASVCRLAFFLRFGRPPHPGLCFSFWSSSGFGRNFFSPLCRAPAASAQQYAKQMQRQILRHGSKHRNKHKRQMHKKGNTQRKNKKRKQRMQQTCNRQQSILGLILFWGWTRCGLLPVRFSEA